MKGSIKAGRKKVEAHKRDQFLYNHVLCSLTSLITFLLFSYPFWLPSTNNLIFSLQSKLPSSLSNTRCFFLLGNLIVFILIGELRSSHSSLALDMYNDHVERSRGYQRIEGSEERCKRVEKECKGRRDETTKVGESGLQHQETERGMKRASRTELNEIPREELHRRVEAYIARVNRQRFLEAKLVDYRRC